MRLTPIILAAGQGTRMRSKLPKMLHPLAGKALVLHALELVAGLTAEKPIVVVGHGMEAVQQAVGDAARFAVQQEQLGTAHALLAAESAAAESGPSDLVLVTAGDMPLLRADTLQKLVQLQASNPGPLSLLTVELDDPHGFGRVLRAPDDSVRAIVEEAAATPEERAVRELNASVYCFQAAWLWPALRRIKVSAKGEYYLTDLVQLAAQDGLTVRALKTDDPSEAIGINTRVHLAEAEAVLRRRITTRWMLEGVTIIDPATTFIEPGVTIGADTTVWPNTYLRGKTSIGEGCNLGPDTIIENSQVGAGCRILASYLESSTLEENVKMGPFCHLRPGAHLAKGVKMGNFGEVKGSYLGEGVHMGHFSYIGDATIGAHTNIGAGTITCNYDGVHKFKTEIGEDAFIGSDTMLVAPLKIGKGGRTGAGAVVTHDVPDGGTVIGVPARPYEKKGPIDS
jgi:bifunctional UDP-N-acetylglucosamine pyrophosphorylase/glucosamine-1-phosphate N-acetyltransferase